MTILGAIHTVLTITNSFERFQAFDGTATKGQIGCVHVCIFQKEFIHCNLEQLQTEQKLNGCNLSRCGNPGTWRFKPASLDNAFNTYLSHFLLLMYCSECL